MIPDWSPVLLGPLDSLLSALMGETVTREDFVADESTWGVIPKRIFTAEALADFERCWPQ
ncbi:hypothetical protein [Tsukamurella tyrosinosolvens]|uniref:hypothetical protein n=1 Tax=Tsukamurella tyrosinosolvens TaxID=57704 RepID=UPI0034618BBC